MSKPTTAFAVRHVLVLLGVVALQLPVAAAEPEWIRVESPHFELYTTARARYGRDTIDYFERIRYFFGTATNVKLPDKRVTIIAFASDKQFEPYRPNEFASAYYRAGLGRDYIVLGRIHDEVRRLAAHEYVHLLIRHSGLDVPLWLNEGLAELYSSLKPIGKQVRVGDVLPNRLRYLRQKTMMPLEELTAVDHSSPHYNERNRAGVFYSQSWALTHMINLSDGYREGAGRLMMGLAKGATAAEAFQHAYGRSLDQVHRDLRSYVRGDSFQAAVYDIKIEKSDDEIEAAPAGGLQTGLLLGDLVAGRSNEQARKLYEQTMEAFPQAPAAKEALGYLNLAEGNREAAKQLFGEAVTLNSTNAKLYYDYALILRQDGAPNGEVIPLLDRVVQLNYDHQQARLYLGYLLMDEEQFEKALVMFARIKRVDREQGVSLYRALSYAYLRTGNKEEAQKSLALAKQHAQSPKEIDSVTKMQDLLDWQDANPQAVANATFAAGQENNGPPPVRPAEPAPHGGDETSGEVVPAPVDTTVTITGKLEHFECAGGKAKMQVAVGGELQHLAITDPGEIVVTGADAGLFEFTCGPQNSRRLTIEYEPQEDSDPGTIGEVRVIHLE